MFVRGSADAAEGRPDMLGDSCEVLRFSESRSPLPLSSPSPPPPPPPVNSRWSEFGNFRRYLNGRMQTMTSGTSNGDSDACPECRDRYESLKKAKSMQSSTSLNSYNGGSSQIRKDICRNVRLQRAQPEEDESCAVILDKDFHSLHRNVPALRRRDVDTTAIRQHYYPEGGWGWIICGAGFVVHLFTTGLQLSFGPLYLHMVHHIGNHALMNTGTAWIGPLCFSVSLFATPMVIAICKKKSIRLTAILGGLIMALGCLFASFAHQLHQIILSYGIIMGIGISLVRETSSLMLGQYFKKRREFVEMVTQAGAGIGITLISVFYKEAVGKLGWRLGLQAITGILLLMFFLGILYRSASLYHPQRRAIVHLKNQKNKIKEKKGQRKTEKSPLLDFSSLRIRTVQILLLSSGTAAFGVYTPVFYLVLQGYKEGLEHNTLILLETFLGFATALGCIGFGLIVLRPSENCLISRQYLCQTALIGIGISLLALGTIQGYHGYAFFVWIYGICLGGFFYSLKMFTMERVKAKHFTRAWGFVQGAEAIPLLLGVPITGYINQNHPKAGYYLSFFSAVIGAALLYFVGVSPKEDKITSLPLPAQTNNNPKANVCICPSSSPRRFNVRSHLPKSVSFATTMDIPDPPLISYVSEERLPQYFMPYDDFRSGGLPGRGRVLRPCKSLPEGLARQFYHSYRVPRNIQVIEQMTTSV